MVAYRRSKSKENFKLSVLKVVAVAYERWSLTRGSKYSDLTFGILENWSLTRGGRNRRVDCIHKQQVTSVPYIYIFIWILAKSPNDMSVRLNKQNFNTKINKEKSNKME